jgi:hypothetical protein
MRMAPLVVVVMLSSLYGLHRLCLALEARGYLYYLHRRSSSTGAARMFLPFQELIDPPAKQVVQAEDVQMKKVEADDPTTDDGRPSRQWRPRLPGKNSPFEDVIRRPPPPARP